MKVKINDKDIELKNTVRSLLIYENITKKTFSGDSVQDILTYLYCVVLASSKDYSIKFNDFLDAIDDNPNILNDFTEWIMNETQVNDSIKKK